jgi:hypothetical protein
MHLTTSRSPFPPQKNLPPRLPTLQERGISLVAADIAAPLLNKTLSGPVPMLTGPVAYYKDVNVSKQDLLGEALHAPMDYLGTTTLAGETVRVWALHLMNNMLHAFWYDTVADRSVRRIAMGDFGDLDVLRVVDVDAAAGGAAYRHLFLPPLRGLSTMLDDAAPLAEAGSAPAAVTMPERLTLNAMQPFINRAMVAAPASAAARRATVAAALEATDPETGEALAHLAHARGLQLGSDIVCQADNKCPAKVSERAASRASPEASVSKLGAGQPCA